MNEPRSGDPSASRRAPRTRASDAQRTAVLEALDAAFADGRLSRLEHLERTRLGVRSKFVDELRPLVADLRGTDADLGLGEPDAQEPDTSPNETGRSRPRRRRGPLVAISAGIVTVAAATFLASAPAGSSLDSEPSPPGPLHTLEGMTRMLESAEDEFGGQDLTTFIIYGDGASVSHVDPADSDIGLSHQFRGNWQDPTVVSPDELPEFQVADIDPAVVMAAIDAAPGELDMDDAETSHVSIYSDALGDPEYRISVSDGDNGDLGTLTVGIDGEVREVHRPD